MSLVLDTTALLDMNILDEDDPRYLELVHRTENQHCYITSVVAAQIYYRLNKDVGTERADAILEMMRSGEWITIADDSRLITGAAQAMDYGAPPSIAFTAALAMKLDIPVVAGDKSYDNLERNGFCGVVRY